MTSSQRHHNIRWQMHFCSFFVLDCVNTYATWLFVVCCTEGTGSAYLLSSSVLSTQMPNETPQLKWQAGARDCDCDLYSGAKLPQRNYTFSKRTARNHAPEMDAFWLFIQTSIFASAELPKSNALKNWPLDVKASSCKTSHWVQKSFLLNMMEIPPTVAQRNMEWELIPYLLHVQSSPIYSLFTSHKITFPTILRFFKNFFWGAGE